jgi:cytochrome c553
MSRVWTRRALRASGLLALFTACAFAAAPSTVVRTRPPTANGAPCEACHGAYGQGAPPAAIPRLEGQSADYLAKQLRDYENGSRENPVMRNFARGLSDSERAQLGAYYATLSPPHSAPVVPDNAPKVDAQQLMRGRQLAVEGAEPERVQACDNCHGPDGSGLPQSAPYLAGQSVEYLESQLKAWQQGTRKNDAGKQMVSVAKRLSSADVTAVSAYFASLGTGTN